MTIQDLVGKTITKIEREPIRTSIWIEFEDGTQLSLSAGSTWMHNDRWGTVEYSFESRPEKK